MDEKIKSEILQGGEKDVFQKALTYLQQKAVVPYADFKRLREWYRSLAFSVVGYAQLDIVSTVCASLVGKDTGSEGRHS